MQKSDPTENGNAPNRSEFEILVIGAGIAGLSFIYALKQSQIYKDGLVNYRIIEKREGPGTDLGYPIHLSSTALESLKNLLTSTDLKKFNKFQEKLPIYHDGITISTSKNEILYRMIRSPGIKSMIEREDLMNIFRDSIEENDNQNNDNNNNNNDNNKIEYGKYVINLIQYNTHKVEVVFNDEERIKVDLVVGADGIFSSTRNQLYSPSQYRVPYESNKTTKFNKHELEKLPWTTINLRSSNKKIIENWLKDQNGVNTIVGDRFSATLIPVNKGNDKTVKSTDSDDPELLGIPDTQLKENSNQAHHADSTDYIITEGENDSGVEYDNTKPAGQRSVEQVYIALTIPTNWLLKNHNGKEVKLSNFTKNSQFLHDLENDSIGIEWSTKKEFQVYSLRKTLTGGGGKGRIVLIGDSSHGTVPFCGSGASNAILDGVDLVRCLERSFEGFDSDSGNSLRDLQTHNLKLQLDKFSKSSKKRNNKLITNSKRLLWLAQGETLSFRLIRKIVFKTLDFIESVSGDRDKMEIQVRNAIERDTVIKMTKCM
ncbi:uncharacterized protein L201_006387 [Kwoniella dendrophila CBS 6074]|uniref:FAD-binding domain-containing protein n=1 Tax=Kwoniella dendrophila CBS 6074 TaxID=1295534 RepID=A0AAX4K138_9TREE